MSAQGGGAPRLASTPETKSPPSPQRSSVGWLVWVLLGLTWLATVQVRPLLDPDEGRYAEIPREMLVSGDWVTPRLNGVLYFEKPVLQYWATAAIYAVAGQGEWTARLWTVGLAFLCLPLVYAWARRLKGPQSGLIALTALAVSPLFGVLGHLNMLDPGFTFWLSLALCGFTLGQGGNMPPTIARNWMYLAWVSAGLAVLSKGIVVGVLCGSSLVAYSVLERDGGIWRRLHGLSGGALFLAVTVPWFLAVSAANPHFAQFFFVHEHFQRFLTKVHHRAEPWWFFLPLLLLGVLPWVGSLVRGLREWARTPEHGPLVPFKPMKFLLIFAGITLVFFSASGSKLPPYILPMMPPLAVVLGLVSWEKAAELRFYRVAAWTGAGLVLATAIGIGVYCVRRNADLPPVVITWGTLAVAAALVPVVLNARRWEGSTLTPALATAAGAMLAWQGLLCEYTFMPAVRSARALVAAVRPYVRPDTPLYSVGQYRETISPYLQRTTYVVGFEGELAFGFGEEPHRMDKDRATFEREWHASANALAFFDPRQWAAYQASGFPGRVVAADAYTVAVVKP